MIISHLNDENSANS